MTSSTSLKNIILEKVICYHRNKIVQNFHSDIFITTKIGNN